MEDFHVQAFLGIESFLQGRVVARELGLRVGLGREDEALLRAREDRERKGEEEGRKTVHGRSLSAATNGNCARRTHRPVW